MKMSLAKVMVRGAFCYSANESFRRGTVLTQEAHTELNVDEITAMNSVLTLGRMQKKSRLEH